jgi:lysozyme family protein
MADFMTAFNYMLPNETYAPTDPRYGQVTTDNDGGQVRFGMNSKSLGVSLVGTTFYTTMSNADAIKVAQNLYNINVWNEICGDKITSQRVASKIFDMAVNSGVTEASKLAQRAANVNVDGVIGPITVAAINLEDESEMLRGLVYWAMWLIEQIVANNPEDSVYEEDWTQRAEKLPTAA